MPSLRKAFCCWWRTSTSAKEEEEEAPAPTEDVPRRLLTAGLLAKQDSETTHAIIQHYGPNETFKELSKRLMKEIVQRDRDDGEKLAKGIQLAVDKGVLPAKVDVEPVTKVSGQTADEIAGKIVAKLGDASKHGCILVLQGLSGTGKGTTVAKLQEKLPNATTWSNGNIFRAITLLAVTYAEQEEMSLEEALTPRILQGFMNMLSFDKYNGSWDVKIDGLGFQHLVTDVEKTVLKESRVARNIPAVAEVTQGEVVKFVGAALQKMAASGMNVLVEGREQTLNHIRTPHRFELVLEDQSLIGQRQAALQVGGKAWEALGKSLDAREDDVEKALDAALKQLTV